MALTLAYNTNGLAHHRLQDAITLLSEIGYRGVALTLDVAHLDPSATDPAALASCSRALGRHRMSAVIETGARYLLDFRRKHAPSLLDDDWSRREAFLGQAMDTALALTDDDDPAIVSFFSGAKPGGLKEGAAWDRLCFRVLRLCQDAVRRSRRLVLAFEPEPGMFVETLAGWRRLRDAVGHPALGLTMDLGHVHLEGSDPARAVHECRDELRQVHLEDMKRPVHEHLPLGEGEIAFEPLLEALGDIDYRGQVAVELSRHSHMGAAMAKQAFEFLSARLPPG